MSNDEHVGNPDMMTLDEAIAHAAEVAGSCDTSCGREHKQLADWLSELRDMKRGPYANAAALRRAVLNIRDVAGSILKLLESGGTLVGTKDVMRQILGLAESVLSEPPRNCDLPYVDRVAMQYAFRDWCNAKGHTMEPKLAYDAFDWLLGTAPAEGQTTEKGDAE